MRNDRHCVAIRQMAGSLSKKSSAIVDLGLALLKTQRHVIVPPGLVEMRKIQSRKAALEHVARRADVAMKGSALAHQRLDGDINAEMAGDDLGGFDGARIGARQHARNAVGGELGRRIGSLSAPLIGQFRVRNTGIDARSRVNRVEFRLAMANE